MPETEAPTPTRLLRERLEHGPLLVVPGAANALAARVIQDTGFEAVYVTGAGVANTFLGAPDVGLVTLTEVAMHVEAIRDAVDLPLIVDADTGFGNPLNVRRTMRVLERAGASAIQLEDQTSPKRCGHFEGKEVISVAEMEHKITAAAEARDRGTLIIARTDAYPIEGFDGAVERCQRYAGAGADVTFLEAPRTKEEVLAVPARVNVPQVVNFVEGGKTPYVPLEELESFGIALFANVALQGAILGMQNALSTLRTAGLGEEIRPTLAPWTERQRIVAKPEFDALERRYS
ncbi:isocitrate lyase/PEP mutase family protein [Spiractinospora alimapuensis]|uniref:isocitrate lyase/PEP mutase family protein n=1 Tax=Spiractinospora alimapuensis TaxID=2820884 RepID=UPI001F181C1F|nr:isocitrate lyase/PEP mutase family protein [Spiractinospora alimapuensis]QVQ53727.1 isocitrate lyase/PEP mutase family protein [Spiractinospora alimapuensis]